MYIKKTKIISEITTQNVNNMASYSDAAKKHTIFRDCSDHVSGVKPIFILELDVIGKPKADSGPDNGHKNEFLVPTEAYRAVEQYINVSNMIGLQRVRGLWRIYLDNQEDRELLLSSTLVLRNKTVNFYTRNPSWYAYKEKKSREKRKQKNTLYMFMHINEEIISPCTFLDLFTFVYVQQAYITCHETTHS